MSVVRCSNRLKRSRLTNVMSDTTVSDRLPDRVLQRVPLQLRENCRGSDEGHSRDRGRLNNPRMDDCRLPRSSYLRRSLDRLKCVPITVGPDLVTGRLWFKLVSNNDS